MIPVEEQPEPADFSPRVREPGAAFLKQVPRPANWKNREYWQRALADLYEAYDGTCAYSAHWIPCDTGVATVDHFIPKSVGPQLAYEWRNYRLASLRMNARKGNHQDVLDPFELELNWFFLDFPSLLVKPNPVLSASQAEQVISTIERLKLNDEICISARQHWIRGFCNGGINFNYLKRDAPFIAYELERQDLVDGIVSIMTA